MLDVTCCFLALLEDANGNFSWFLNPHCLIMTFVSLRASFLTFYERRVREAGCRGQSRPSTCRSVVATGPERLRHASELGLRQNQSGGHGLCAADDRFPEQTRTFDGPGVCGGIAQAHTGRSHPGAQGIGYPVAAADGRAASSGPHQARAPELRRQGNVGADPAGARAGHHCGRLEEMVGSGQARVEKGRPFPGAGEKDRPDCLSGERGLVTGAFDGRLSRGERIESAAECRQRTAEKPDRPGRQKHRGRRSDPDAEHRDRQPPAHATDAGARSDLCYLKLGQLLDQLPAAKHKQALQSFKESSPEHWHEALLGILNTVSVKLCTEFAHLLIQEGKLEQLKELLARLISQHMANSELLLWLAKERSDAFADILGPEVFRAMLTAMERDQFNEKKSNKLRDYILDDQELIVELIESADLEVIKDLTRALQLSPCFDDMDKRSLLARIVKSYPAAQVLISGEQSKQDSALVVSWESLERRKAEYDELVHKKIPANSKEIAVARSYGDLRENHEYKSA
ncbi:MAG: hypothetical protein DME19_17575, partial [Verrucomicrobia bacterium]